ncbi:MAG: hypothetical protein RBT55_14505 [Rhodocyclaceae bacterium]|jgi:hypothetical protein|nr:hypothetical protein [Rhodocyclaceae bacterium]
MQLNRLRVLCLLMAGFLQGGCMVQYTKESDQSVWQERCATTGGWRFCFLVPPSTHEDQIGNDFKVIRGSEGRRLVFGPWNSWRGTRWDELVAVVSHDAPLPASATDSQLLAWAGLWDNAQRKRDIAAGEGPLPKAYKTRVVVDARGRRWALGERRSRELNLPYTRIERSYVTPVGEAELKLEISLQCSYPHPNCSLIDRMISEVRWEKLQ